jgi:hypothetical protein
MTRSLAAAIQLDLAKSIDFHLFGIPFLLFCIALMAIFAYSLISHQKLPIIPWAIARYRWWHFVRWSLTSLLIYHAVRLMYWYRTGELMAWFWSSPVGHLLSNNLLV